MPESKIVWLVGEHVYKPDRNAQWEIVGIFETEGQAVEACTNFNQFIGPIEMNKPEYDHVKWEGCYFPRHNDHEKA